MLWASKGNIKLVPRLGYVILIVANWKKHIDIHHLSFTIHHSSFIIHHSSFIIHHSFTICDDIHYGQINRVYLRVLISLQS